VTCTYRTAQYYSSLREGRNNRLLFRYFRDVTLTITEITESRMTVAQAAILESTLCSPVEFNSYIVATLPGF
jgi:hypothetical protein